MNIYASLYDRKEGKSYPLNLPLSKYNDDTTMFVNCNDTMIKVTCKKMIENEKLDYELDCELIKSIIKSMQTGSNRVYINVAIPPVQSDLCSFCGEKASLKCAKCEYGYYCTRECQVKDWKHANHKQICKIYNQDGETPYFKEKHA